MKIAAYKDKVQFLKMVPLKITFKMTSPIILGKYPIVFDGIFNRAVALDIHGISALDKDTENLPDLPLPLKKSGTTKKYYHASIMLYNNSHLDRSFWVKRWDSENENFIVKKQRKKIDTSRGFFKAYKTDFTYLSTPEVYFYAYGNKEEVEKLLKKYIKNIGTKGSQGYGKVLNIVVEEIETDKSIFNNGELMRPVPLDELDITNETYFKKVMAYKPCYFDIKNYTLCAVPKPELWAVN